jgi:hypothetical protein
MCNPRIQIALGKPALEPINVVRLGGIHTAHSGSGGTERDGLWFDPGFSPRSVFRLDKPEKIQSNSRWALRRIERSPYKERVVDALLQFVRALDERDSTVSFIKLWTALETLATPGRADYDRLVKRCSFLFKEGEFHRQVLEHLKEYRNSIVHLGEASEHSRTHCFQLQLYFVNIVWFHIRNARIFQSIEEANEFLDLPPQADLIKRRIQLAQKAIRFLR